MISINAKRSQMLSSSRRLFDFKKRIMSSWNNHADTKTSAKKFKDKFSSYKFVNDSLPKYQDLTVKRNKDNQTFGMSAAALAD